MTIVAMNRHEGRRKVAVIGSGITGASAAWSLRDVADVTLFEAADRAGGHTATVDVDYAGKAISVDTGFIVYNTLNYPELTNLFAHLDVATHESNMGFSLSLDEGRLEWCGETLRTIFAQKRNWLSPSFYRMLREILRFNRICVADREAGVMTQLSIGDYLLLRKFSGEFRENYLIPMAAAIWSTPRARMMEFPATSFVTFFENHRLIHNERPAWRTVTGGARSYLDKLLAPVSDRIRLSTPVRQVMRDPLGVTIHTDAEAPEHFDEVILASHSDQSLALLADPSPSEEAILGAIRYRPNRVVLHRDPRLMPVRRMAWSAWNYARRTDDTGHSDVCVTYWMNRLQGIDAACPLFVSLNPIVEPREELVFGEWSYDHPQFDASAIAAQRDLPLIQGARSTWYAGAWTGYGFHEDGLRSGLDAAQALGGTVPWRKSDADAYAVAAE